MSGQGRPRAGWWDVKAKIAILAVAGVMGAASPSASLWAQSAPAPQAVPAESPRPASPPDQTPPPASAPQGTEGRPAPTPTEDLMTAEQVVLSPVPVLIKSGTASWDTGFDTLVAALRAISDELTRLGLTRSGDVMVLYTSSDEAGFAFEAQIPFTGTTQDKPREGLSLGASLSGKVLKFTHHGSFADMDETYEAIANYLDTKNLLAQDFYLERYRTDPMSTPPDALDVDIFVPLK